MSTLKLENIKHENSSTNNMVMNSNGTVSVTNGLTIDAAGAIPLTVDRATSDGSIIDVQKDGTSVGSIRSLSGDITIDGPSEHTGLRFEAADITPRHNGAASNNYTSLGTASSRYKDLFLGGGLYVGGTAAANHLDDYETGSFQLTMTGESSGAPVGYGIYTKVGNMCHFNWYSGTRTISSVVAPVLTGLPFTHTSPYGAGGAYASVVFSHNTYVTNSSAGYINIGSTSIYPTANNSSGGGSVTTGSKYVMCSGSYYCD